EAERKVLARFAFEALAELAARHELRLLATTSEGRRVDADSHLDRRLLDVNARKRAAFPAGREVDDRVADVDFFDAGDGDDFARRRFRNRRALQALERREHLDRALDDAAVL